MLAFCAFLGKVGCKGWIPKTYIFGCIVKDTADVFAWTVVIILLSQLFEKLFLMLMKKGFDGVMK